LKNQKFAVAWVALIFSAAAGFASPAIGFAAETAAAVEHSSALADAQIPLYIVAAVNSPDRPAADKERDKSRRPDQLMAFFGLKPGMQAADLWAAGGYTTELLARIAGPTGKVYSQNLPFTERSKPMEKIWRTRLAEPGLSNVVAVVKPFDAPDVLPVAPNTLDAVIIDLNYHDLVGQGRDRAKLNAAILTALKSGGVYGVVDNSAQAGSGARAADTLHRIDEDFEVGEIEKAGFKLAATSDILRNPKDDRTLPVFKMAHMQDRFVLKFVKP
jgi:predicted methyltransferase